MDYDHIEISDISSLSSLPSSPLSSPPSSPILSPQWEANLITITPPPSQDAGDDMPPPRKRRKIEPKKRTTQHLDLTSLTAQSEYDRQQAEDTLMHALRERRKIVVVAGAGISVSAGIPDFRSSHGLFKSLRGEHKLKGSGKQLFDASVYKDDSSTSHFHDMVRQLSGMADNAKPTPFHNLLARLSREDRLLRLYTQNVDGLDTSLPPLATTVPLAHKGPWPKTIQLHGGLEKMVCQKCHQITDFDATLFQGPQPPACPQCVLEDDARTNVAGKRSHGIGRLRPRMVLYNEHNPDDEAIGAVTTADFRTRPDAVVVVGTSMKIPGVRRIVSQMCKIVRDRREGTTIWINRDGIPAGKDLEDCWDLIVKGDSDDVAKMARLREWDDPNLSGMEDYTDSEVERVKNRQGEVRINIPSSPEKPKVFSQAVKKRLSTATMTPPRSQNGDSDRSGNEKKHTPIKLKLILPARNPEAKAKEVTSLVKNPASSGRKLTDVLTGKENVSKAKSKTSYQKSDKGPQKRGRKPIASKNQPRLNDLAKVTKQKAVSALNTAKKEPLSPKRESEINSEQRSRFVPIMPTPRDSSAETSPTPEVSIYTPPLSTTSCGHSAPQSPSWSNQETISPKGNVPKDLLRLLN